MENEVQSSRLVNSASGEARCLRGDRRNTRRVRDLNWNACTLMSVFNCLLFPSLSFLMRMV